MLKHIPDFVLFAAFPRFQINWDSMLPLSDLPGFTQLSLNSNGFNPLEQHESFLQLLFLPTVCPSPLAPATAVLLLTLPWEPLVDHCLGNSGLIPPSQDSPQWLNNGFCKHQHLLVQGWHCGMWQHLAAEH